MSTLAEVQAQLGNILAAMPLKLQKVDANFLDETEPPFEGAVASNSSGQFYVADYNGSGELFWKAVRDTLNTQEQNASEVFLNFEIPVGFISSTISFGRVLEGSDYSVFAQLEIPADANEDMFYLMSTSNINNTQFNLHISHPVLSPGFRIHIHARGYDQVIDPVIDNTPKHSEIEVDGQTVYIDPSYSTEDIEEWEDFYGTLEDHDCKVFCINGYYPLYKWADCAEAASPQGSYHTHPSLVTDPKTGSELWFAMPEGVDQFHGNWPHYPGN